MNTRLFLAFLLAFNCQLFAQDSTDIASDDSIKTHSPRKALIYSAILPGAGQLYNHIAMSPGKGKRNVYWKIPVIYAGLGSTGYLLIQNQLLLHDIKTEYNKRQDDPTYIGTDWNLYDNNDLVVFYKQTLTYRDLSIIAFGAVYLLQIVDANIEGHFVHFDISPDLSLQITPKLTTLNSPGIGLTLNFH